MTDRPMFDDDYLPDWLKAAGITYAGKAATGKLSSPPRAGARTSGVPWSKQVPADMPKNPPAPRVNLPWKVEGYRPSPTPAYNDVPWTGEAPGGGKRSTQSTPQTEPTELPADSLWGNIRLNAFGSLVSPGEEEARSAPVPSFFESQTKPPPLPTTSPSSGSGDDWMSAFRDEAETAAPFEETPAASEGDLWGESLVQGDFHAVESALPGGFFDQQTSQGDLENPFDLPEQSPFDEPLNWEMPDSGTSSTVPPASAASELPMDQDLLDLFGQTSEAEDELSDLFGSIPVAGMAEEEPQATPSPDLGVNWMDAFSDESAEGLTGEGSQDALADLVGTPLITEQDLPGLLGKAPQVDAPDAWDLPTPVGQPTQPTQSAPPAAMGTGDLPDWFKEEPTPEEDLDLQSWDTLPPSVPSQAPAPTADMPSAQEVPDFFASFVEETPESPQPSTTAPPAVSWITNTNKLPDVPPKDEFFQEPEWMAHSETDLVSDYVPPDEWMGARDADAAVPAENLDLPDWMKGITPIEESSTPVGAPGGASSPEDLAFDQLDWLNNVDFEAAVSAPDQGRIQPSSPAPRAPEPVAAGEFDLLDSSKLNIDELLNLPPSGALVPTEESPEEIQDVDFDEVIDLPEVVMAPSAEPTAVLPIAPEEPESTSLADTKSRAGGSLLATQALPKAPSPAGPTEQAGPLPTPDATPLPEWVADMRAVDLPVVLRVGDQQIKINDKPLAELPDQLKLFREKSKTFIEKPAPTSPPPTGPLSGITEAVFPAPVVNAGAVPTVKSIESVVTPDQSRRIQVLQNLLSVQDDILTNRIDANAIIAVPETPAAPKKGQPSLFKLDRFLIAVILAVAVVLPFFTNALSLVPPPSLARLPAAVQSDFNEVTSAVDGLQSGQGVIVALEYAPTGAGELNDLALMLLRDLIKHGARPFIVSTSPAGAMQSALLASKLSAESPTAAIVLVGYLPGGPLGVKGLAEAVSAPGYWRSFAFGSDLNGKALTLTDAEISALQDAPAFVLAETQEDVRTWIEQYRTATRAFRVALLTSASAGAAARAYADLPNAQGRLLGPLVSLRDALIYQEMRGLFPNETAATRAAQRWQSVSVGALAASLILLVGVFIGLVSGLRRRRA